MRTDTNSSSRPSLVLSYLPFPFPVKKIYTENVMLLVGEQVQEVVAQPELAVGVAEAVLVFKPPAVEVKQAVKASLDYRVTSTVEH